MTAVVLSYSFDKDISVYLYNTRGEAARDAQDMYDEEYRTEAQENGLHMGECVRPDESHNGKITALNADGTEDTCFYTLTDQVYFQDI